MLKNRYQGSLAGLSDCEDNSYVLADFRMSIFSNYMNDGLFF